MSSQEEQNKLTGELWVTQGITISTEKRRTRGGVDRKFSIEILEKAFYALRASFLRGHKKYEKEGKLQNKGWIFYESMLFLKSKPKTSEKFYIYRTTVKVCCGKIAAFFCWVWMKNATRGP